MTLLKKLSELKKLLDNLGDPENAIYYCTVCNLKEFKTKTEYIEHFRSEHEKN
jgi:hypothetical protein